ncbi:MAG: hypothetical protein JWO11_2657 [Nocardioides sp.]|nr:hypothetical protein [Nocardioides sp.]
MPEAAFRIFRHYDGKHHGFGDRGVSATSSAQGKLALSHFPHGRTAKVYRYEGQGIDGPDPVPVGSGGFTLTYPAHSITLVALNHT